MLSQNQFHCASSPFLPRWFALRDKKGGRNLLHNRWDFSGNKDACKYSINVGDKFKVVALICANTLQSNTILLQLFLQTHNTQIYHFGFGVFTFSDFKRIPFHMMTATSILTMEINSNIKLLHLKQHKKVDTSIPRNYQLKQKHSEELLP